MEEKQQPPEYAHFKGKEAIQHVIEAHVQGKIAATEIHGTEVPGHIPAGTDAAKETALLLIFLTIVDLFVPVFSKHFALWMGILALAWTLWKAGRSAWLGWSRLEKLHRILEQEKWEIEHYRQQERDELRVLYQAKGFEGKLLEDVLDVLMADNERLLRVMVEEELGLSLQSHEHPLKQSLGAALGCVFAFSVCLCGFYLFSALGLTAAGLIVIASASAFAAYFENNRLIPAIVWNLGIAILSIGTLYFLSQLFFKSQS